MSDHERIWLEPRPDEGDFGPEGRLWCQDKVWPGSPDEGEPTEYIRADIASAEIERLRAENERLQEDVRVARVEAEHMRETSIQNARERNAAEARATSAETDIEGWRRIHLEITAERDALAARLAVMDAAIDWALGEGDSDFGDNKPENAKPFWWRTELRRRAREARASAEEKGRPDGQ